MKIQLLAFVHDLAVLYVGNPGSWALLLYCVWLQRRQRKMEAAVSQAVTVEAFLHPGSTHMARLRIPDGQRLRASLVRLRTRVWQAAENWPSLLWSPPERLV